MKLVTASLAGDDHLTSHRQPILCREIRSDDLILLDGFDGLRDGDVKAWLLTIVRNCWLSAGRAKQRRGHTVLEDSIVDAGPDPEETAIQTGHARRLEAMIARLPDDFREVLILRELQDLSYREIAEITGAPIGTVMSRLARARTMLREFVKEGA